MAQPPERFFRVEANGVLYLTVGYTPTEDGPSFFDQAVLFARFAVRSYKHVMRSRDVWLANNRMQPTAFGSG